MKPVRPTKSKESAASKVAPLEHLFAFAAGCWLALTLLKFGNPVIFGKMITAPKNLPEFLLAPWPVAWGYVLTTLVTAFAIKFAKPEFTKRHWPLAALGAWLFWQLLSHTKTVDERLSLATLIHFLFCGISLLIGWAALGRLKSLTWFWIPVLLGFTYVLIAGFDQHHGGLAATREEFYKLPNWQMYPAEYLLKMQSERIFSTLVYPNAFAGVILLLLPILLLKLWEISARWPRVPRAVCLGLFGYLAVACLYWTGSKGGWLIALVMALVLILHLALPTKVKITIMTASLVLGLVFFFVRFSGYFQRGATSVSARFDYWEAALATAKDNPVLGTGPGTFQVPYGKIKPPEAEMARLVHNDFLEQASDSGLVGALAFAAFVFGSMAILYRQRPAGRWDYLLIWIGLLGWVLQSFIEFGLYIPAIAWAAFLFFGILWSRIDNTATIEQR